MKKMSIFIVLFVCVSVCFITSCMNVNNQTINDDGIEVVTNLYHGSRSLKGIKSNLHFEILTDSTMQVSGVGTRSDTIVIPNQVKYLNKIYSITAISYGAFNYSDSLKVCIMPNSVLSIGKNAFANCYNLTKIVLSDSLQEIGERAFFKCYNMDSIILPKSLLTIGDASFHACSNLSRINIPSTVTSIGDDAFTYCSKLTHVIVEDGRKLLSMNIFAHCYELTSLQLPPSLEDIYGNFETCYALNYNIYNNAKYLGSNDNPYCILISAANEDIHNCKIHPNAKRILSRAFMNCNHLSSIIIPHNVDYMGYSVFKGCEHLNSVRLSNKIKEINDNTFEDCKNLTSIVIPQSVVTIRSDAFMNCKKLTKITFSEGLINISDGAFSGCVRLTNFQLPNSLKSIGSKAFSGCTNITSVVIPEGVTTLEKNMFAWCSKLRTIKLPSTITTMYYHAFIGCENLRAIYSNIKDPTQIRYYNGQIYNPKTLQEIADSGPKEFWEYKTCQQAKLYVPIGSIPKYKRMWKFKYIYEIQ